MRLVVALAFVLSGCIPGLVPPAPPSAGPSRTSVALQLVADGLVAPVALVPLPGDGGRLLVADQVGLVHLVDPGGPQPLHEFLDLTDRMVSVGIDVGGGLIYDERGLLGLALHPNYAENGRFFVFYTAPRGPDVPEDFNAETHISEFRVSASNPDRADPGSERILLRFGTPAMNHNGGPLAFGPDGFLYIGVGDGGHAGDVGVGHTPGIGNAQDRSKLLGKILRIDVDGALPYEVPPDNPFAADPAARPEIWATGFRNPWRLSFDEVTGRLFVGDVGQGLFEEVNLVARGGNYGWNRREGLHCFDPDSPNAPPADCPAVGPGGEPLLNPILEYPHEAGAGAPAGIAVIGGFVYRGTGLSELVGRYVFADWSRRFVAPDGSLFVTAEDSQGRWTMSELNIAGAPNGRVGRYILALGQDRAGQLYLLTSDRFGPSGRTGRVFRIVAPG